MTNKRISVIGHRHDLIGGSEHYDDRFKCPLEDLEPPELSGNTNLILN